MTFCTQKVNIDGIYKLVNIAGIQGYQQRDPPEILEAIFPCTQPDTVPNISKQTWYSLFHKSEGINQDREECSL